MFSGTLFVWKNIRSTFSSNIMVQQFVCACATSLKIFKDERCTKLKIKRPMIVLDIAEYPNYCVVFVLLFDQNTPGTGRLK